MKTLKSRAQKIRVAVQITLFISALLLAVLKWLKELGILVLPEISLHAVCPFGGVVTVYEFFSTGGFLPKLHSAAFILMALGLVVALFFGPIFCGYACPFGSYQEWLGKLGRRLFPKKYGRLVPEKMDRVLRYLRYGVLALVLYQTIAAGKLVFQEADPYYALFNFFTGEVAVSAFLVLFAVTVLSLFVERPWCKYLCPYGALLGLFNLIRIFPIRRNAKSCVQCKKCDKACPMQIEISRHGAVRNPQCISCHQCASGSACPVQDTVTLSTGKGGNVK
jgi:polyferredoxin